MQGASHGAGKGRFRVSRTPFISQSPVALLTTFESARGVVQVESMDPMPSMKKAGECQAGFSGQGTKAAGARNKKQSPKKFSPLQA